MDNYCKIEINSYWFVSRLLIKRIRVKNFFRVAVSSILLFESIRREWNNHRINKYNNYVHLKALSRLCNRCLIKNINSRSGWTYNTDMANVIWPQLSKTQDLTNFLSCTFINWRISEIKWLEKFINKEIKCWNVSVSLSIRLS